MEVRDGRQPSGKAVMNFPDTSTQLLSGKPPSPSYALLYVTAWPVILFGVGYKELSCCLIPTGEQFMQNFESCPSVLMGLMPGTHSSMDPSGYSLVIWLNAESRIRVGSTPVDPSFILTLFRAIAFFLSLPRQHMHRSSLDAGVQEYI